MFTWLQVCKSEKKKNRKKKLMLQSDLARLEAQHCCSNKAKRVSNYLHPVKTQSWEKPLCPTLEAHSNNRKCMCVYDVDRTAGTELPCLAGCSEIPLNQRPYSPSSFPAPPLSLTLILFLPFFFVFLLGPAGNCHVSKTLMGWADSPDKRVNFFLLDAGTHTYTHSILSL